jgi:hypothetical protein
MAVGTGAAILGGTLFSGGLGYLANKQQGDAAADAQAAQADLINAQMRNQQHNSELASSLISRGADDAASSMYGNYAAQQGIMDQAYGQAFGAQNDGTLAARDAMTGGYSGALQRMLYGGVEGRNALQDYTGQSIGALGQGLSGMSGTINNANGMLGSQGRLADLYGGGLREGFETDPGYQFRQQQGEQAINRSAAARGGRLGGDTMKALSEFNQGLASQEFDKYANRQMGMAQSLDARDQQNQMARFGAQMNLANAYNSAGANAAGILSNTGSNLASLASSTGRDAAQMQNQQANSMGAFENMAGSNLANMYLGQGQTGAGLANQYYGGMGNLAMQEAMAKANAYTQGAAAQGNLAQSMLPTMTGTVPYAGGGTAAVGNALNSGMQNYMFWQMMQGQNPGVAG